MGWLVDNDVIEAPKDGNHGEKHPTSDEYVEEGIPFLMASDIRNGRVDLENCKYIKNEPNNLIRALHERGMCFSLIKQLLEKWLF